LAAATPPSQDQLVKAQRLPQLAQRPDIASCAGVQKLQACQWVAGGLCGARSALSALQTGNELSTSPPGSTRPNVQMVRWRGEPDSLR